MPGASILVFYGNGQVFYKSPFQTIYLLYNPFLEGVFSIKNFTLPEVI